MTNLEIGLTVFAAVQAAGIYLLTKYNRDLTLIKDKLVLMCEDAEKSEDRLQNKVIELEKKAKLSNDVIGVLNDLKRGGSLLHVEVIDRNDVFYHQGGQYR